MDELDGLKSRFYAEDAPDLINPEDDYYALLRSELESEAQGLEADSWSSTTDQNYLRTLSKELVKRQDVIYELIQTEMHHVRTLKILLHVYVRELRKCLLMEETNLENVFHSINILLTLHQHFLDSLKERRALFQAEEGPDSYQISRLGDILISQFSGERGERMKVCYGVFCSLHIEGVSLYKEQLQRNKKLQSHMKKIRQLPLVRRLDIPECFLLVTQRITKYPVLLERIIQNTEADTEEHASLVEALALIRDTIYQVDAQVSEYEKSARLREIARRMDPKYPGRLRNGGLFKREDLHTTTLLHEGDVTWKPTPAKHKDIHAVLLPEVLLLLQEKDQKFMFAAVENHLPVISLEELIVREVAHEDKAMFLICASSSMMYEIHTSSREERSTWMALIRDAVNKYSEPQEENSFDAVLSDYRDNLRIRDDEIKQSLTEKLECVVSLSETVLAQEIPHPKLLLRGDSTDLQQGEALLKGAIEEVETLLTLHFRDEPEEDQAQDSTTDDSDAESEPGGSENGLPGPSERRIPDLEYCDETIELSADEETPLPHTISTFFSVPEAYSRLLVMAQKLYSLQAVITYQDTEMEVLRTMVEMNKRPNRSCSNILLEQERQRNQEKQREELANFHKQQAQHRDEQQRWEKERERQRILAETTEAELQDRQERFRILEEKLQEEKQELEKQREAYQHDLERLRDSTRAVERDRERLELERIKRNKSIANPRLLNYDEPSQPSAATSDSLKSFSLGSPGRGLRLISPLLARRTMANSDEIPPSVPPRRESITPQSVKVEVPIHLISTTNQVHKASSVQQQIPSKLAGRSKSKGKSSKYKGSHQRAHSAASIDVTQLVPIRARGSEGGSLRLKGSGSPHKVRHSETFSSQESILGRAPQSLITHKRNGDGPPPLPPPFPKEVLKQDKERVIFL